MTKARDLADFVSAGNPLADGTIDVADINGVTATTDEINYLDGVTSNIQTQFDGLITDLVSDTTPQLGGNLDLNSSSITGTGNINITGNISLTGTVDGRDIAADGTKLDGIEAGADVTDTTNVTAAGALMDSELTNITAVKALNQGVATGDSPTFAGGTFTGTVAATSFTGDGSNLTGIDHADTSSQASVNNSNGTVIQDVTLDTYGHVTGLTSVDLDSRYATGRGIHGWGTINGSGSISIRNSYNLSSITFVNGYRYRYAWSSTIPNSNYVVSGLNRDNSGDMRVLYMDSNCEYSTSQTATVAKNRNDGYQYPQYMMVQVTK